MIYNMRCVFFTELQAAMDSKQRAERMVELQERRRSLQSLLNTRIAELKRVCLQEAVSVEKKSEFNEVVSQML